MVTKNEKDFLLNVSCSTLPFSNSSYSSPSSSSSSSSSAAALAAKHVANDAATIVSSIDSLNADKMETCLDIIDVDAENTSLDIKVSSAISNEIKEIIDVDSNSSTLRITSTSDEIISLSSPETVQSDTTPKRQQSPPLPFLRSHLPQLSRQSHSSFSINKNEEFEFEVPEEAPVFVPTEQEFKNPLTYISKIRPIAEKYGICKIRPPSTWQPPFTVDVDKLRFIPRVQRLNELEAKTRVKLNFLDQIAKFWELQGSSLKIPMVERKALDLYSLHRIVQEEGGLEHTTNGRKWSKIASRMGYPVGKSVGTILKGHYERILYPFDVFTSGKSDEIKPKLESESDDHDYKPHGILSRQNVTPPTETTARRSQRFLVKAENLQKMEDNCDDFDEVVDVKISKKVTPQKSNNENKLNGSGSTIADVAANEAAAARAELRRLQIFGAGPKMAGFKVRPNQQQTGQITPTKSRMNGAGNSRQQRQSNCRRNHADPLAKYVCHICTRGDGEEAMLLCDGCDDSYHTFCLIPPLADIPKGDWRCPKCVVEEVSKPVEAFGFEQAQREYTLQQFGEMADQFKADYFNIPVHLVPTELVEREFWRIVSSIDEDVAVEYGADLHTMDHGSGFPTKSSLYLLPGDLEYADSSWNLNNLPLLEESVLGHINADISGMKVPWMYVGMCFATFCWHNEDHWSYSINYLHWGEPKTWYGVPGNKAEAFENTMRRAAPELFHSQPDLLHQLVTIMNPNTLMNAGVPVFRTDQHAGEFIITFPRAYHAGFNQGYNFAEAVNFAPADWIKMGRECINHYSNLRRFCVFSHDELVCKMALDPDKLNLGIATACYLDMAEMVDTEKKLRKCLLEWGVTKAEREAFELIPDDERQCDVCKTTCFLSAVTCVCVKSLVCLRHYSELCKCPPEKHTLKYRYTLDELPLMLRKLKVKAESFETWITKVRDVLDPTTPTTMTLDELQQLAQEAEDKKFPTSVLLERLNSAVLEAEKCVTVIQQLDINKVRTRTRNSSCEIAKYKLTTEELDMFVQEIDNLCCVIKEGSSVRELQQIGKEFSDLAKYLLKEPINEIKETAVEKMIEEGSGLCIELPQMKPLRALLEKIKWYNNVREIRESDEKTPLHVIKKLLTEGNALHVVGEVDDSLIQQELHDLQSIMVDVEDWEADSKKCFESGTQHDIPEIEELLKRADTIDGKLQSQSILEDALKKAKEWLATVEILQANENYPYFHTLENVVNRGKNIPFQLEELKRMEEHLISARAWKQKTSRTFLKRNSCLELMEVLSPRANPIMLPSGVLSSNGNSSSSDKIGATAIPYAIYDEKQFTEDMGPAQMVVAFKNAEEKEMDDMRKLREKNQCKNPEKDSYCVCRQPFQGVMYKCHLCLDWFHAGCVRNYTNTCTNNSINHTNNTPTKPSRNSTGGPQNQAASTNTLISPLATGRARDRDPKYLCESCQRSKRPRLETILTLLVSLQKLPIRLPEGEALQCLTERAMNWQDRARQVLDTSEVVNALASIQKQQASTDATNDGSTGMRDVEHAYSVPVELPSGLNSIQSVGSLAVKHETSVQIQTVKSTAQLSGPLIQLQKSTADKIDELMMEGDLLEVSLDETQYLWRLYNASKPDITDLAHIRSKYNIKLHANETLVSNIRKRHSDEHQNDVFLKKSKMRNAASGGEHSFQTYDKTVIICDDDDEDEEMEDIEYSENELTRTAQDDTVFTVISVGANDAATADSKATMQKPKRGRKMTMTTKDNDAMSTTIVESTMLLNDSTHQQQQQQQQQLAQSKKKKRGRKSGANQQRQESNSKDDARNVATASTSDEDEECSALNCIRPSGREVDWVQCDGGCNEWFHMLCVGLIKSQVKADDDFICKKCKKITANSTVHAASTVTSSVSNTNKKTNISAKNDGNSIKNGTTVAATTTTTTITGKKRSMRSNEEVTASSDNKTNSSEQHVANATGTADNTKEIESKSRPNNSSKSDSQLISDDETTTSIHSNSISTKSMDATTLSPATATTNSASATSTTSISAATSTTKLSDTKTNSSTNVPATAAVASARKKKNQQKS